ncbi:MAG: prepilin-type N-terminal cleavage/methylation domain-containing protein [Myxococcota bacterium]
MSRKTKGFSLLELAVVLTILSMLVSLAVPTYTTYVHRAREAEAFLQVETIAYLEEVRVLELGAPIALPPNPSSRPGPRPAMFEQQSAWSDLGLRIEGPLYFQYRVDLEGSDHFIVTALGDVDGDGEFTRVTLSSQDLVVRRTIGPASNDELGAGVTGGRQR